MMLPRVILPWPSRDLSPNGRVHWAVKRRAAIQQGNDARALALAAGWRSLNAEPDEVQVALTFCPPSLRRFDLDNALASIKAALDQLAATLGVDDSLFVPTLRRGEKCRLGGIIVDARLVGEAVPNTWRRIDDVAADQIAATISHRKGAAE